MLTAQDHATVVRSYYDALNRREIDKNLSLVTDDVKWMNIPFNVDFSGRTGFREYLENWTKGMPDCKVEIVNVIARLIPTTIRIWLVFARKRRAIR